MHKYIRLEDDFITEARPSSKTSQYDSEEADKTFNIVRCSPKKKEEKKKIILD
jgi:hypothetical protein